AIWMMDLAWPSISVSSTTLAPRFSPLGEGEGMGVYNAANALAGLLGAALGGWLAAHFGYEATLALAAVSGVAALSLALLLPPPPKVAPAVPSSPAPAGAGPKS
ncbi:MAG TPA: MFS transporter, partial [Candidatus Limnocylindria bacterium]|nr:MFS transporter [Candidatus Limnocylindria bacterium]